MTNDTFPRNENDQEINLPGQSNEYDPNRQLPDEDSDSPENPVEPDTDETDPVDEKNPSELEEDLVPEQPNSGESKLDYTIDENEAPAYDINSNIEQNPGNQKGKEGVENLPNNDAYNQNLDESGT